VGEKPVTVAVQVISVVEPAAADDGVQETLVLGIFIVAFRMSVPTDGAYPVPGDGV